MGVQLYPPIIPNVLTAMYNDTEGIAIAIPFSLNRAVSASQIYNFNIKIKTVFDNKTIYIGNILNLSDEDYAQGQPAAIAEMIAAGVISGHIESAPALVVGQYYKIQVAFVNYSDATGGSSPSDTVGIYSSVATIKYTALPEVAIQGDLSTTEDNIFAYTYQGSFDNSNDPSETRDQYRFDLLLNDEVAFTSDWLFKDQYKENDAYTFTDIQENEVYQLRYGVKTINGVEVYSELYPVIKYEIVPSELAAASLCAANNFDNGYVQLSLDDVTTEMDAVDGMFRLLRKSSLEDLWTELTRIHFDGSTKIPSSWIYKDFLIEQGMSYTYALQQYNDHNIYSVKMLSSSVEADFEDSFLYDGTKQLKLRFNPKVTSYKINRQEQKMETIGSQYPFFVRNSKIAYHEFPISGLCSYWMDEEELFMTDEELGLTKEDDARSKTEEGPTTDFSGRRGRTLTLQGYNFAAERKFKNTLLEWLGNGKPKFFKSPSEGNFIIRVMNPSLTPEDKVSRMIHNFSATGYEAMEINQDNLFASGFIKEDDEDFVKGEEDTFNKIIDWEENVTEYYVTGVSNQFNLLKQGIINSIIATNKELVTPVDIEYFGKLSDVKASSINNIFDLDGEANIDMYSHIGGYTEIYPMNVEYMYQITDDNKQSENLSTYSHEAYPYVYYKNITNSLQGISTNTATRRTASHIEFSSSLYQQSTHIISNLYIDDFENKTYTYNLEEDLQLSQQSGLYFYTVGPRVYIQINYAYKYTYES